MIWLKVVLTARPWKIDAIVRFARLLGVKVEYHAGGCRGSVDGAWPPVPGPLPPMPAPPEAKR
jgi:hypothetical protein